VYTFTDHSVYIIELRKIFLTNILSLWHVLQAWINYCNWPTLIDCVKNNPPHSHKSVSQLCLLRAALQETVYRSYHGRQLWPNKSLPVTSASRHSGTLRHQFCGTEVSCGRSVRLPNKWRHWPAPVPFNGLKFVAKTAWQRRRWAVSSVNRTERTCCAYER